MTSIIDTKEWAAAIMKENFPEEFENTEFAKDVIEQKKVSRRGRPRKYPRVEVKVAKKRGRPTKNTVTSEKKSRGQELMEALGLVGLKTRKEFVKTKSQTEIQIEEMNKKYKDAFEKKWNFKIKDFTIVMIEGKGYCITHKDWKGTYITNEERFIKSEKDAKSFVRMYIKDSKLPLERRGQEFKFHLVED